MYPIPVKLLRELLPGPAQPIKKAVSSLVVFSHNVICAETEGMLAELSIETGVPFHVTVRADDLRRFLRPLSNKSHIEVLAYADHVEMVCQEGEVRIASSIQTVPLSSDFNLAIKQHGTKSCFSGDCAVHVPKDRLLSLLERLEPFVARDDMRPDLNGIGIEYRELPISGEMKIVAAATDGHILAVEGIGDMLALFPYRGYSQSFPCPLSRLRTVIKSAEHTVKVQLWSDDIGNDWIEYSTPQWAVTLKSLCEPGKGYIDYSKTIPVREAGPAGPELDLMMSYIRVFAKIAEAIRIDLSTPEQMVIQAHGATRYPGVEAKSIQATGIKEPFREACGFNAANLLKLGKFMQSDRIRLYSCYRRGYPLLTFRADGEGKICIIAPLRIHDSSHCPI